MNTLQIDEALSKDVYCLPVYAGALPRDVFADTFDPNEKRLYVINTHPSDKPGEHWLALYNKPDEAVFFDSYGLPLDTYRPIQRTLSDKKIVSDTTRLQDLGNDVCGDYCVVFCMAMARDVALNVFIDYWKRRDDEEVRRVVNEWRLSDR